MAQAMANKLAPLFMANGRADNFRSIYKREIVPKEYKKYDWQQKNWGDEIFRLFLSYYNIIISEILGKIKFWGKKNLDKIWPQQPISYLLAAFAAARSVSEASRAKSAAFISLIATFSFILLYSFWYYKFLFWY